MILRFKFRGGWRQLILQAAFLAGFIYELINLALANEPTKFSRLGSILVFCGALFLAFNAKPLLHWQFLEFEGVALAEDCRGYAFAVLLMEIAYIGFGTLVWGYGDAAVCWLHDEEWNKCLS